MYYPEKETWNLKNKTNNDFPAWMSYFGFIYTLQLMMLLVQMSIFSRSTFTSRKGEAVPTPRLQAVAWDLIRAWPVPPFIVGLSLGTLRTTPVRLFDDSSNRNKFHPVLRFRTCLCCHQDALKWLTDKPQDFLGNSGTRFSLSALLVVSWVKFLDETNGVQLCHDYRENSAWCRNHMPIGDCSLMVNTV